MADIEPGLNLLSSEDQTNKSLEDAVVPVVFGGDEGESTATTLGAQQDNDTLGNGLARAGSSQAGEALAPSITDSIRPSSAQTAAASTDAPSATSNVQSTPLKRFTSVNINRRFHEKNSSASSSATPSVGTNQTTSKLTTTTAVRPTQQPVPASSRLVTAKLSTNTNGQPPLGWSRPGSASSPIPNGIQPQEASQALSNTLSASSASQSRSASRNEKAEGSKRESSSTSKAAWGRVAPSNVAGIPKPSAQHDFPTVEEVAIGIQHAHLQQQMESQKAAEELAAQKRAMLQTADSFRGVHLDPNAHHWDEMEDEDADFLDDVIDFGDGRQYHVQAEMEAEEAAQGMLQGDENFPNAEVPSTNAAPVTKENRFRDDIDRSWPRNQTGLSPRSPIDLEKPSIPETASPKGSLPSLSPEKQHRALFNERSNRLEPLNRPFASGSTRGNMNGVRQEERESKVVQVLQKPSLPKMPEQPRAWTGPHSKTLPANGRLPVSTLEERRPDMGPPRLQPTNAWQRAPSNTAPRRSSISIPEQTMQLQSAHVPALLEHAAGPSVHSRRPSVATTALGSIADAGESPKSTTVEVVAIDSEEVVKATMLSAAERAKKRRMEEEAEREAQKERARKKAAELEAKIESEKAKARPAEQSAKSPVESKGAPLSSRGPLPSSAPRPRGSSFGASQSVNQHRPRALFDRPLVTSSSPADQGSWRTAPTRNLSLQKEDIAPPQPAVVPEEHPKEEIKAVDLQMVQPVPSAIVPAPTQIGANHPDVFSFLSDAVGAEVVDFQELGSLSGLPSVPQPAQDVTSDTQTSPKTPFSPRKPRPVASDFFDAPIDGTRPGVPSTSSSEQMSWRRKAEPPKESPNSLSDAVASPPPPTLLENRGKSFRDRSPPRVHDSKGLGPLLSPASEYRQGTTSFNSRHDRDLHPTSYQGYERYPKASPAQWRENSLSALNDTMSRIRGVLDGLHIQDIPMELLVTSKEFPPTPPNRPITPTDVPPIGYRHAPSGKSSTGSSLLLLPKHHTPARAAFDVTRMEPPSVPKPAWNTFSVKLPRVSRDPPPPLDKKQLGYFQLPLGAVNWRMLLTFNPIDHLSRKSLDRDVSLFQRIGKYKWRPLRVHLSTRKLINSTLDRRAAEAAKPLVPIPGPVPIFRVVLPKASKHKLPSLKGGWTFVSGRSSDAASWRKPRLVPGSTVQILEVRSRSPPPQPTPSLAPVVTIAKPKGLLTRRSRQKSEPRLPPGAAIGFAGMSDAQKPLAEPVATLVSFTVTSEIENPVVDPREPTNVIDPVIRPPDDPGKTCELSTKTVDTAKLFTPTTPERSVSNSLPGPATPWGKSPLAFSVLGSPSKLAPESELVKAVWMQTSDIGDTPSGNSLKNIQDDLTAIPFTLQDVKSEDGSTPPPQNVIPPGPVAPPSRIDVARAFQQVPETASETQSSPFSNNMSPHQSSLRSLPSQGSMTSLPPYGSPLLPHSPSPTLMYPPMPSMQHIWQAAPNHSGAFVRAPAAGYIVHQPHPTYSPYPPNAGLHVMYPAASMPHMTPVQPVQGYMNGRGRGGPPVMSPVGTRPAAIGQPTSGAPMYILAPGPGRPAFDPSAPAYIPQRQQQNGLYTPGPAPTQPFPRPW